VDLPEWYQTYSEELDKKLENKTDSSNDDSDILKEAKDLFGE
jgi:hypothetical protein